MINRQNQILKIITENKSIEVSKLAELLDVSQVTIRKDLDQLENMRFIKREHGYAILSSTDEINNRLAYHYEEKQKIAQAACQLIQEGETVIIESGSCCALLAKEIAKNIRDVTIITNSAFIADYIRRFPFAKIILLGGDYQVNSQCMVGPITKLCIKNFFVDKLFIGTDGFIEKFGFTGNDHMRSATVRDMAEQAKNIIVLTESEKFSRQGVVALIPLKQTNIVVTDDGISEDKEKFLLENNVDVKKISIAL